MEILLGETYRVKFNTKDGENSALFIGTKEEARTHFEKMNKKREPLKILNIEDVS